MKRLAGSMILTTLRLSAQLRLWIERPRIIGVTGSVGKSSCVHLLGIVLRNYFRTHTTWHGNSETGLPLEILGLRETLGDFSIISWLKIFLLSPFAALFPRKRYNLLIAEMGVDSPNPPKNMEYLLRFLHPEIGVLLSVAPVHTEQFSEGLRGTTDRAALLRAIAEEKGKMLVALPAHGTAVINQDSEYIRELVPKISAAVLRFGKSPEADLQITAYEVSLEGTAFGFSFQGKNIVIMLRGYVLQEEYGSIVAAVLAVAAALHLPLADVAHTLQEQFMLPPGRMSLLKGRNNLTILDSSYNSSPAALKSALRLLNAIPVKGKKIAVLGDMRELGVLAAAEHKAIVPLLKKCCDHIVLVGPLMKQYVYPELLKQKFLKTRLHWFPNSLGVGTFIAQRIANPGDLVLVKGSQNAIFLEQTVKELLADPNQARQTLCRQSAFWERQREACFLSTSSEASSPA